MEDIKQRNIELLSKYEPKDVLTYFANLCNIPHGSGNEKEISEYIASVLKPLCKEVKVYPNGTIYAYQDATPGCENKKTICLQAHCDMVCAKIEGSNHDFLKDPLDLQVNDGILSAKETSLGADDGIGVAYMLAIFADKNIKHGPLETLITTSEETDMDGATKFPKGVLKSKYIINLDSEDTDLFCIGCEGGYEFSVINKVERQKSNELTQQIQFDVNGGITGHSGNCIRMKILNAIKTVFQIVKIVKDKCPIALVKADGGTFKNVIPGFCKCTFAIRPSDFETVKQIANDCFEQIKLEFIDREKNIALTINKVESQLDPIKYETSEGIIEAYSASFNGVFALNEHYPIAEGSSNFGTLETKQNEIIATYMARSLYKNQKATIVNTILSAFYGTEFTWTINNSYPQWTPVVEVNPLEEKFKEVFTKIVGKEPHSIVTEGGLEIGLLMDNNPQLVGISIGCDIRGVHSTEEKLPLDKVKVSYDVLKELIQQMD